MTEETSGIGPDGSTDTAEGGEASRPTAVGPAGGLGGSAAASYPVSLPPLPEITRDEGGASADAADTRPRRTRAERAARARIVARRRARTAALVAGVGVAAVVLIAIAAMAAGSRPSHTSGSPGGSWSATGASVHAQTVPITATPEFARLGRMRIHLPIQADSITAVAFHQAAYGRSYHMVSLVPNADMKRAFARVKGGHKFPVACSASKVLGITERSGERVMDSLWLGSVLRVWRTGRPGKPDTAVDAGAKPGTAVIAPVTGTVERIRPYMLYGKIPDFEIHIKPDDMPQADLVVIHVTNLLVSPGQRVIGGVSHIASVRLISDRIKVQLGEYTGDPGNHVHIQFNWPKTNPAQLD